MKDIQKILKDAQQMQKKMQDAQASLGNQISTVTAAGGAIELKINGNGNFIGLKIDQEFLNEDSSIIEATLLEAIKDAQQKSEKTRESEMAKLTGGFSLPF